MGEVLFLFHCQAVPAVWLQGRCLSVVVNISLSKPGLVLAPSPSQPSIPIPCPASQAGSAACAAAGAVGYWLETSPFRQGLFQLTQQVAQTGLTIGLGRCRE